MSRHLFDRTRHGVEADLEPAEAGVIAHLCRELTGFLDDDAAEGVPGSGPEAREAVRRRLFPSAYLDPTEEQAESEWQRLVHGDLVDGRRTALETVGRTLAHARERHGRYQVILSDEEAEAWLAVFNDARLTLGTLLDVSEDMDPSVFDPDDPAAGSFAVYWWLGLVQEHLVAALSG
ncbi:MAG TPA: DUF2017 family protein [Acidimicrobiia bacterium]|nr:DUF2017 family protein [Acidimicrobiia bacterium]